MAISVCFVCLGNICRSPTAEGIMRHLVHEAGLSDLIAIDSAGTGAWHVGERADARARATARARGMELTSIARRFERDDFARFDYVVAMDRRNRDDLQRLAGDDTDARGKVSLLRAHAGHPTADQDVPDPYYEDNFDDVFDICETGCRALLQQLRDAHDL